MGILVVAALVSCTYPAPTARGAVQVMARAGPTCPVVSDPPDPACADRPVAGAEIAVHDEEGVEVARMTTDADGRAALQLPPGRYVVVPQPVEGLMGTAQPVTVTVLRGDAAELVSITYDTGIR